ncbi:hypothetical protein [Bradyrhizobium centrolobii]|nr:hypothetical protein [Bradyrhizobium centrolobii]
MTVIISKETVRAVAHRCLNVVIASEAKQSRISPRLQPGLLRRFRSSQ